MQAQTLYESSLPLSCIRRGFGLAVDSPESSHDFVRTTLAETQPCLKDKGPCYLFREMHGVVERG